MSEPVAVAAPERVRLSAVVMTHPRRREAALALRRRHPGLDLAVVEDPRPDGPPSALRTARPAWRAVPDDASHHLVVQDDMELVAGFAEHARTAARAMPGRILCFFTEWGSRTSHALRLAAVAGASWVPVLDPYVPTNALLLPADVARALASAAEAVDDSVPDDVFLLRYVQEHDLVPYVSVPNLAEQTPARSLVGNDLILGPRPSALFGGALDRFRLGARVWLPAVVPHLLLLEGYSVCQIRESPAGSARPPGGGPAPLRQRWSVVRTHEYLAGLGLTLPQLFDGFRSDLARVDGPGRLRAVVAEPLLLQLWLTAFAYGVVMEPPGGLDDTLADPVAAAALRTFVPGAVRRFVPRRLLDRLPVLAAPLIGGAIRSGFRAAAAGRKAASR
jgi:hypothetical protein